jgi:tetratricopeptide (TPR) repeat protein
LGEYDSALYYLKNVEEKRKENNPENYNPNAASYRYGQVLVGVGRTEEGKSIINYSLQKNEKIIDLGKEGTVTALFNNAGLHSFLGETERAIEYLQRYIEISCWRGGTFYLMQVDPLFDNIRNTPEYKEMVKNGHAENARMRVKIARLETAGEL